MSSILSGTAKLAGWTLAAAIVTSALISSPDGSGRLSSLRKLFAPSAAQPPVRSGADEAPRALAPPLAAPAQPMRFGDEIELKPGAGGNFHAVAEIDGLDVPMVVDTGASLVVLSYEQADRLGFHPPPSDFRLVSQTANGRAAFATIKLPYIRLGPIEVDDVVAAVGSQGAIGQEGLLGMSFLGRLQSYQMAEGRLILRN
jgi:aspartyl protease family protein